MPNKWQRRDDISPREVMDIIEEYGAPTTSEIKMILRTDSQSVRRPLAILWGHNKIFIMPAYNGLVFMKVTGQGKGRPNPTKTRKEHGKGTPRQEGVASRTRREIRAVTPSTDTNGKQGTGSKETAIRELGLRLDRYEITPEQYSSLRKRLEKGL